MYLKEAIAGLVMLFSGLWLQYDIGVALTTCGCITLFVSAFVSMITYLSGPDKKKKRNTAEDW